MNGHRTPRRTAVGPQLLPAGQRPTSRTPVLLIVPLLALLLACSLVVTGCGSSGNDAAETEATTAAAESTTVSTEAELAEGTFPVTVTDDNGNSVTINAKPVRIVSTSPAGTQTLFALGVGSRVVGVNSLDDYPPQVADIPKVGDYQANTEAVMALSPDLVVGYSGNEEALAPVQAAGAPVLIFNPTTLEGIYANITAIGAATGATGAAADLVESTRAQVTEITEAATASGESPRVFYALDSTLYTCGPGSFVDELLTLASASNVAADPTAGAAGDAYPQFSAEQLVASDPDVILLSGLAYASADEFTSDARFSGLTAVREGRVLIIDDSLLTIPGPRITEGLRILAEAIHPEAF
jgi:iron complex transport system substrate-binding protein